ncbi:hypothetical protein TruAng_011399 [Truncatella angustata]|nr:hypothetical protein TruAng_011399 [Truncatella angustata]
MTRTMFSTLNKSDHAKRKRVLADRYANTNIMRSVSMDGIKERSGRFIDHCTASVGGSLDIFICNHHLFHPYGSDALRKQQDEEIMKEVAFDDSLQNRLIKYYNPALYSLIGGILRVFAKPRETPGADHLVLSASSKTDPEPFTLVSRMQEKAHGMDHLDMAAECLDHMAAGIDTTGVVLEGLRCTPAIPMSLPRYVPKGGRTIDGYFVPERTIVSSQAYSAHRIDQKVFPEPDLFNPNRWLEQSGDAERKRLFFAFASGGRGCVGKHLALAEMKTLLVDVYSRFTTLPDPSMTQDMMEMSDQLISSQPLGKKCLIRFLPLEKNAKE